MRVAVLYSGGKDSTFAIDAAMKKGWEIVYLLSVKPTRKDCFLFHYATVEYTKELAKILGIPHIYTTCDVAEPTEEAKIVRDIVAKNPVDAVVLGGIGLQVTQLTSIQKALLPYGIETFAMHAGEDHDKVMEQAIKSGYEIIISQVASDGLGKWLGKKLTLGNFEQFKSDSKKFGFHVGGEGGYYDTLVVDGPIFSKKLLVGEMKITMDDTYCGHVTVKNYKVVEKVLANK